MKDGNEKDKIEVHCEDKAEVDHEDGVVVLTEEVEAEAADGGGEEVEVDGAEGDVGRMEDEGEKEEIHSNEKEKDVEEQRGNKQRRS